MCVDFIHLKLFNDFRRNLFNNNYEIAQHKGCVEEWMRHMWWTCTASSLLTLSQTWFVTSLHPVGSSTRSAVWLAASAGGQVPVVTKW